MNDIEKAKQALARRAAGYEATETVEEYSVEDGELKLQKRKVTVKHIPPEISAVKVLLGGAAADLSGMTDEELELERQRLLKELGEEQKEHN